MVRCCNYEDRRDSPEIRQQAAGKRVLSAGQRPGHIPQLRNRSVSQQDGNISLPEAARYEEWQGACRLHVGLRRKGRL